MQVTRLISIHMHKLCNNTDPKENVKAYGHGKC